eukprot:8240228-Ditylum_brightwellii.AAC.1
MRPTLEWDDTKTVDNYFALFDEEVDNNDAKYDAVTPEEVRKWQDHLLSMQRHVLEQVLEATPTLLDGKLGHYKKRTCKLELIDNV